MKHNCELAPKPGERWCRPYLREACSLLTRSFTNILKPLFNLDNDGMAWMLLCSVKRCFAQAGHRGVYVSHRVTQSVLRTGLSAGVRAGSDRIHRQGTAVTTHFAQTLPLSNLSVASLVRAMRKACTIRTLLVMWAASLAYLVAPVSIAEPAPNRDSATPTGLSGSAWTDCHVEWRLRFCGPTESTPENESPERQRVKARDVLRAMADALLGEGFQLLNIGRHSGPSFLEPAHDTGPIQYYVLSDSNGFRMRMRTKDEGWSLSLRNSPAEYNDEPLAVKIGVDIRW